MTNASTAAPTHRLSAQWRKSNVQVEFTGSAGTYLDVGGQCWYVLVCDSKGRPIRQEEDVPLECGVMIAEPDRLHIARNAAKRSARELPFAIWMVLAKATPAQFDSINAQSSLRPDSPD